MQFFATPYTIHFDDTMAYGSHHFLTSFKFQCAAREALLFGDLVYDAEGVKESLEGVHLLTADAYSRNLSPARLGERVAILLTLEEYHRASARFCYRVINASGEPVCAGFQTLLCADAQSSLTCPLPDPLRQALDRLRCICEPERQKSFRDQVLAGGRGIESLFDSQCRDVAATFLRERYPHPQVVAAQEVEGASLAADSLDDAAEPLEAWFFCGQGVFQPELLSDRITEMTQVAPEMLQELERCAAIAEQWVGGDATAIVSGSSSQCAAAVAANPHLLQVAIHLQNDLGARLLRAHGREPDVVAGHSFGEIAAFGAAGCFDLPTGVRIVCHRVRAIESHATAGGGLLAVSANRSMVATELAINHLHDLVIAGRNHPLQTVVSGPLEQLEQLRNALQSLGVAAISVPSPAAFHHPSLRDAATAWLQELQTLPLHPPKTALYSPNGRRFVSASDKIAALLASQLLKPFDLQGAASDLERLGVTRFVDCGSTGSLAKILRKVTSDDVDVQAARPRARAARNGHRPANATADDGTDVGGNRVTSPAEPTHAEPAEGPDTLAESSGPQKPMIDVAIVGAGCILPGGAHSPESLFNAIMEQRNGVMDQRGIDPHWTEDFYSEQLTPDRSTTNLTGRIEDSEIAPPPGVDADVFQQFSRAQKLLCMAVAPCRDALQDAQRVLCLIGSTADGYDDQDVEFSLRYAGIDPRAVESHLGSAKRQEPHDAVLEVFEKVVRPGLEVVLVDAACASSLYTMALGVEALQMGEADVVLAGGVFCPGPGNSCLFSQFRGTTATGLRPFDAAADGVIFSEGAAVVALRRLSDARHLELPVAALVKGFGLSSDGRSSSANVPQTRGQLLSLERCYANHAIDPASIDAIEAHGTSTPIGDSTEVETLRQFFANRVQKPVPIHSLKGLLGHAGWAAGTASIIAVCEYLRNGQFPAQAGMNEPAKRLAESRETLIVPSSVQPLPSGKRRIAIDGFGFGGANAHVVLERFVESLEPGTEADFRHERPDELVIVAAHAMDPTVEHEGVLRFDRSNAALPDGHVVLPDLADDMDISQQLAVCLVDGVASQLASPEDRRELGIVLALAGKTERGVEATMRVLSNRLKRQLADHGEAIAALDSACGAARPSGPYTLQCMMPNVASGRAALQFDLNGPNLVVDAGEDSLEAAFSAATLLLRSGGSGAQVVIAAAIHASRWRLNKDGDASHADEFAAAFAITTREYAEQHGLRVLSDARAALAGRKPTADSAVESTKLRVDGVLANLRKAGRDVGDVGDGATSNESASEPLRETAPSARTSLPIHTPVWVEAPLILDSDTPQHRGSKVVAIASASSDLGEITAALETQEGDFRLLAVGRPDADFYDSRVTHVNLEDAGSREAGLRVVETFAPDILLAVQRVNSWDPSVVLEQLGSDNSLCELMFLASQRQVERLTAGELELYSVVMDGWDETIHPSTGPFAGLLKSIRRELPRARVAALATRRLSMAEAIDLLGAERRSTVNEVEVAYDGSRRLARRLRATSPLDGSLPPVTLDADSVVIASGGASGVTAVLVEALLKDFGCTVIAMGRSELEPGPVGLEPSVAESEFYSNYMQEHPGAAAVDMKRAFDRARARWEAHRTIDELSRESGHIEYRVTDLNDAAQVAKTIRDIVHDYGRIDLILHGAGVQISKRLADRSLAEFRRTFSVKVSGLRNLVQQCRAQLHHEPPAHVLTSAYSIFGNDGQHDYGAANETLDRLCRFSGAHGGPHWSSIAWLAWAGIGMTRGSEYHALSKQRQLTTLTPDDGQMIFREVMSGRTHAEINVPMSELEHVRYQAPTVPAPDNSVAERLLEHRVDLSRISCLPHHKVRGVETLPGAWILDQMVVAAMPLAESPGRMESVTIRDAVFHRFVKRSDQEPNLRVVAEARGDWIKAWMIGDLSHATGVPLAKDILFAEASLSFQHAESLLRSRLSEVAGSPSENRQRFTDPYCQSAGAVQGMAGDATHDAAGAGPGSGAGRRYDVELSGPFDCVRDIEIESNGRRARFMPGPEDLGTHGIPGLVLDAALRVGAMYADSTSSLYVPLRIGHLVAPVGSHAREFSTSPMEIRTTPPVVQDGQVRWERTEAIDQWGTPRLVLEDALATRLS